MILTTPRAQPALWAGRLWLDGGLTCNVPHPLGHTTWAVSPRGMETAIRPGRTTRPGAGSEAPVAGRDYGLFSLLPSCSDDCEVVQQVPYLSVRCTHVLCPCDTSQRRMASSMPSISSRHPGCGRRLLPLRPRSGVLRHPTHTCHSLPAARLVLSRASHAPHIADTSRYRTQGRLRCCCSLQRRQMTRSGRWDVVLRVQAWLPCLQLFTVQVTSKIIGFYAFIATIALNNNN